MKQSNNFASKTNILHTTSEQNSLATSLQAHLPSELMYESMTKWKKEVRFSLKLALFGLYSLTVFSVGGYYVGSQFKGAIVNNRGVSEENLLAAIKTSSDNRDSTIQKQQSEIAELKEKLQEQLAKEMFKNSETTIPETISFNQENYDILKYKHRIEAEKLERQQDANLKNFIKTLDLSSQIDIAKLETFKDNQKLELFSLKKKLESTRIKFKDDKFIVLR